VTALALTTAPGLNAKPLFPPKGRGKGLALLASSIIVVFLAQVVVLPVQSKEETIFFFVELDVGGQDW